MQRQSRVECWGRCKGGWRGKLFIAFLISSMVLLLSSAALACELGQVSPNQGLQGEVLEVTLEGVGFSYSQFYEVSFGPGIEVEVLNMLPITVEPVPETLLLRLSISETAPPGPHTIIVNGYVASCTAEGAFTVEESGPQENQPPVADFTLSPSEPTVGDAIVFDATASFDPDGEIVDYLWDFGDGATDVGVTATHSYAEPGPYLVGLTVVDDLGAEGFAQQEVTVQEQVGPGLGTTIDRVNWNGYTSNIGETNTMLDMGEGSPSTRFLNVVADFNGDGTIADYTTDWGVQPEWIVRNLPVPPDIGGRLLLGASFPILDETITAEAVFGIGDTLLDSPATSAPVSPAGTITVGTTERLVVSPGAGGATPPTLQPSEVGFSLTIWGFPLDIVFHGGVPDIPQKPNECAPTSTANSLRWLAQKNGFNDKLPISNGDLVNALVEHMNTSSVNGTTVENQVKGKKEFIKDKGLSLAVEGQDDQGRGSLTKTKPTFEFLLDQMRKGQDVEMCFGFLENNKRKGGHCVTVVGVVKLGSSLGVYIHDPDDTAKGTAKTDFYRLEKRSDGYLQLKGYGRNNRIDTVVAESPTPTSKCPTRNPTAIITPQNPRGTKGHGTSLFPYKITFDGTPSHDNDNCGDPPTIRKYEWTVTQNLLPNPEQPSAQPLSGTGPTFPVTFNAPGTYTVKLTVTDNDNETDSTAVQVTIGNRKPWIKITDRRVELTPSGQVRRWVIRFKAKDPDPPDKSLQQSIDVSYQDVNGTHQVSGAPPLHVDFAGGWAIVSAEITATDPHGAKGVLTDIVLLWRSGAARQQLQQHLRGGGANAFLKAQLQKILQNKKGADWVKKNPAKATAAVNRALDRIVNMKLRNTFRHVVTSGQSSAVMALQEEVWEGMYQEGSELLGIAPTAEFSFSPAQPVAGESVRFDASASVPSEDGSSIGTYEWDFDDDGEVDAEGPTASFTFTAPGDYDVTLRVVDDAGAEDLEIVTVSVGGQGAVSPVCSYAGADKIIDGADLIGAIQNYARGELSGADLIQVIQYYASGTACDQPLPGASAASASAAPFALESVGFTGSAFVAEGAGIAAIEVQVYDLAGREVFSGAARGNTLAFSGLNSDGRVLANGVYLYTVTAYGIGGEVERSRVKKLVLLR